MGRSVALLCIFVVAAGCDLGGDGGGGSIERAELKGLVLQPEDLPRYFIRFDEGRQVSADATEGERADPARFGRIDGWKARYRRTGSQRTRGPLVVESRVDLFESVDGASDDLAAVRQTGYVEAERPELGDEARAFSARQMGVSSGARYFLLVWREDNATASVLVSGFEGRIAFGDALALGRKQAARTAHAAG